MTIYKPCDIRGDAAGELTPALYQGWGRTLGFRLPPMAKFVVGGDVRASTPPFLAALVDGLCHAGLDVVDLGLLPTPMIYYAKQRLHADGCAIVTASHNPAAVNGLKWMVGDGRRRPRKWRRWQQSAAGTAGDGAARSVTKPRPLDISFDYVACLQETFVRFSDRPPARGARPDARLLGGAGAALPARHLPAVRLFHDPRHGRRRSSAAARPIARSPAS